LDDAWVLSEIGGVEIFKGIKASFRDPFGC